MIKILLIGAGQIGSRHLQALAKLDLPVSIDVVDQSPASLAVAEERFHQIPDCGFVKEINFRSSFQLSPDKIDFCIIATTSNARVSITRELIKEKQVKHILFEKVLFQKISDYDEIQSLLNANNVKAWVNCCRRMYPIYKELKSHFVKNEKITYFAQGGDWGMASNAIHLIDHLAYFNSTPDFTFDISHLDQNVWDSKRDGYVELTGTLLGRQKNGSEIVLHSRKGSLSPLTISLMGESCCCTLNEPDGIMHFATPESNWKSETRTLTIPFQSELTHLVLKELIENETCSLTSFEDSCTMHKPLLAALAIHLKKFGDSVYDGVPIT